jgi:hypothetical protein
VGLTTKVIRFVCEKIAQNRAQSIFGQNKCVTFNAEEEGQNKVRVTFRIFFKKTARNKQWPNRRKYAQSGHPVVRLPCIASGKDRGRCPAGSTGSCTGSISSSCRRESGSGADFMKRFRTKFGDKTELKIKLKMELM